MPARRNVTITNVLSAPGRWLVQLDRAAARELAAAPADAAIHVGARCPSLDCRAGGCGGSQWGHLTAALDWQ